MKIILISSMFLLASNGILGQPDAADLQKQLDELRIRIKTLEKENETVKSKDKSYDSALYCSMRSEVFNAFTHISQLDFDLMNTTEKIAVTGLFTKLMQASNPTSDILGFRFTEVIFSTAEKHFLAILKTDRDKKRFTQVIRKIIDNPIVSSLANSNPVTSVVSAIISTIAGFTTERVELEKEGGRIKDVSVEQLDAFENRSINDFRNELQVYIDFYDAMIIVSDEYIKDLDYLNDKYSYLIQLVNDYKTQVMNDPAVEESNLLMNLSNLFPDPALENVNYSSLIHDERIRKCMDLASKYPILHQQVNEFKKEYNTLIIRFLSDYKSILETTKNFPGQDIDKTKSDLLIIDIELFIINHLNDKYN